MGKNKQRQEKEFYEFKEWYRKANRKTGGLILKATAARLLDTPRQNISRMIRIGKIKTYEFRSEKYIGINDIEKIIKKRAKKND